MKFLRRLAFGALPLLFVASCGSPGGPVAKPPGLSQESGPSCHPAFDPLHPFVAEWPGTSLSELDVTSQGGVVVVGYDPCTAKMKVLSECRAGGAYSYVDAAPHPDTFTMRTAGDVDVSLPFGAVSVKARLSSGKKLDFRYTSYGQRVTQQAPAMLTGACGSATHYVRAMTLGSYELASSADVLASGGVDVLGKGGKGELTDSAKIEKQGGAGCEAASVSDKPAKCAVLQMALAPLGVDAAGNVASAGFGQDLGAITVVPHVSTLSDRPIGAAGAIHDPDYITLLEQLMWAKRSDRDSLASASARAARWDVVAKHQGNNPLRGQAAARCDEWRRVADAEGKRREQVQKMCAERAKDETNLRRLLALDEDVVSKEQKASYRREMAQAYAPWEREVRECGGGGESGGMVAIPAGTFMMGSNAGEADEKPEHSVTVGAFSMDVTEVTVSAYAACVGTGACAPAPTTVDWKDIKEDDRQLGNQFCNGNRSDRQNHPINCVDWSHADTYCRAVGKRLPTEEEWEYAARGSEGRKYPWGDAAPGPTLLNACGDECVALGARLGKTWSRMYAGNDGWESTAPVGRFPAGKSPFGLFDMAGNVWEWTASGYSADYSKNRTTDARVFRGGGWNVDDASHVRGAFRGRDAPAVRDSLVGFRCARAN